MSIRYGSYYSGIDVKINFKTKTINTIAGDPDNWINGCEIYKS